LLFIFHHKYHTVADDFTMLTNIENLKDVPDMCYCIYMVP
jgi:hypothetical protein